MKNKKRIAICFYGQTRTFDVLNEVHKKLEDDNIEFDFFVSTWNDFVDKSQFDFCKEKEFIDPNIISFGGNTEREAYLIHRVNLLKSKTELQESFLYDYILWTRSEMWFDRNSLIEFFHKKIERINYEIITSTNIKEHNGKPHLEEDFWFAGTTEAFDLYSTGWKSFFKIRPRIHSRHGGHTYHAWVIKTQNLLNHRALQHDELIWKTQWLKNEEVLIERL
tara:strand:- start:1984 stop:2646 length:663 start_codon:yes stop_codon:yes gene_type:complete